MRPVHFAGHAAGPGPAASADKQAVSGDSPGC